MSIKTHIEDLAKKLEGEFTSTPHGVFGENTSLFLDNLPEGVTKKMVDDVENAKTDFVAAASLAHGRLGTALLKKNKELDRTSLKISVGRDEVTSTYLRLRESPNPQDRTKTIKTMGALSTNYTSVSGVGSKGSLKQVKLALTEMATKELGG